MTFDKMADSRFGHNGNRNRLHDFSNHFWVGHTGYTSLSSNICGYTFESHDCYCACFFCDPRLEKLLVAMSILVSVGMESLGDVWMVREMGEMTHLFGIHYIHNDTSL